MTNQIDLENYNLIAGLDEVAWGSLAGPIISVVALFDKEGVLKLPTGVRDSKKTTEDQRRLLYKPILACAKSVGIGHAWPKEIDSFGPYPALQLSYRRALDELSIVPDILIVDGSREIQSWDKCKQVCVPKGDSLHKEVSAASIIAKYVRDEMMAEYSRERRRRGLPDYNWLDNSGYGTPDHISEIKKNGLVIDPEDVSENQHAYIHRLKYCRKAINVFAL